MKRISAREYAEIVQKHEKTVQRMCRAGKLKARRVGRSWEIDVAASERLLSLKFGNSLEREMTKKGM
jgi:hypothetical protein